MSGTTRAAVPAARTVTAGVTVVLMLVLMASVGARYVGAATTAPSFLRADYQQLGNNHVVAEFNGDGKPDVAGQGAQSGAVLLNRGDGTLGARVEYPVADWTQDLAAGDFNGDGAVDLAVTINNPQISLALLTGRGDGTFNPAVHFPNTSGLDSPAVVATDLDNDGRLDLVIAHSIACWTAPCVVGLSASVMLGNGDGTFQPTREIEVGRGMAKIAVGDFNRDGVKDLAIAGDSSRLYLLLGVGDGTFRQQPTLTLTADTFGVDGTDVDVADFNRDAIQDLVVAIALNGSRTAILIGNGDGTFRQPLILTEPGLRVPHYQAVGDYNLDGFQDLAISLGDGTAGLMEIRNGNGDGTFQAPVMYLVPPDKSSLGGYAIVPADFNGDSKTDIALGIVGATPSFAILLNSTGAAPPPTPAAPTLLSPAQDAKPAQPVSFDWTDVSAATSYRIQVDDSNTFSTPVVIDRTVTASQFTATSTLAAQRHWWRVRGINAAGTAGAWSTVRRFTPQAATSSPSLSTIAVSPSTVVGGDGAQGTVTLTGGAPSGGSVVTLTSSSTAASVPASVTVAAGGTSATFPVGTASVTASTSVTISGSYGGATRGTTLTVTPPAAPAALSAVSVNPTSVTGGNASQGTVSLTGAAPSGGFAVSVASSDPSAAVPPTVTVPAGSTAVTFAITTSAVTTSTTVTITASAGGVTRSATLTVAPPAPTATLTVTATGRSGERITSTPSGINVTVGSTGSASFATGTSVTLSATNGRDVVWSGACSSGGNKAKSCTLTVNADATVTADVK